VTYTDGTSLDLTQSFSEWAHPQNYPGEFLVKTATYVNTGKGTSQTTNASLYGYLVPLDGAKTVQTISLPQNSDVEILAMTLQSPAAPVNLEQAFNRSNGFVTDGLVFSREQQLREAFEVYIVGNFRATITNQANWNWVIKYTMQKPERDALNRVVARHPVVTGEGLKRATEVVRERFPEIENSESRNAVQSLEIATMTEPAAIWGGVTLITAIFVVLPAMAAAFFFRGGLILRGVDLALVNNKGATPARFRILWRSVIAWLPFWIALIGMLVLIRGANAYYAKDESVLLAANIAAVGLWALAAGLMIFSTLLPARSWQDRLAGTWLVPK
jgi:hypothetical protein